jgi:transcriptional regulator of acetoin/glycerol metabolism
MGQRIWEIEGTMPRAERDAIVAALEYCAYNVTAAARRLQIGRSTLYRLIDAYQVSARPRRDHADAPRPGGG